MLWRQMQRVRPRWSAKWCCRSWKHVRITVMPYTLRDQLITAQEARNQARRELNQALVRLQDAQARIAELEATLSTVQAAVVSVADYWAWRTYASPEEIAQHDEANREAVQTLVDAALLAMTLEGQPP
jgi:hypothetical protein